MPYDVAGHPLLSSAAQAEDILPQAAAAEATLDAALEQRGYGRLSDTGFEAGTTEYQRAALATVYQVNYQVEAGTVAEVYGSQDRGDRSAGYRGGVLNPFPTVSPRALAIALQLVDAPSAGTWPRAGGVR